MQDETHGPSCAACSEHIQHIPIRLWLFWARCWDRSSRTGQQVQGARRYSIALCRVKALGKHDLTPFPFLRLDAAPESAVTQFLRGRRERENQLQVLINRLLHHVLSRWLLLLNTSPAPLNPSSTSLGEISFTLRALQCPSHQETRGHFLLLPSGVQLPRSDLPEEYLTREAG